MNNNIKQIPTQLNYISWSKHRITELKQYNKLFILIILTLIITNITTAGVMIHNNLIASESKLNNEIIQAELIPLEPIGE